MNYLKEKYNQPTLVSTFASCTMQSTDQSLQKSLQVSIPDKNYFLKSPTLLKIFKPANTQSTQTPNLDTDKNLTLTQDRRPATNSVLPQLAVTCKIEAECSYQTFVQVDSEVLRNRQLRQHAKR